MSRISKLDWHIATHVLYAQLKRATTGGPLVPLYMDVHQELRAVTLEAIREAHLIDLALQQKHGVVFRKYWLDAESGHLFCLVEGPSKEAVYSVHYDAHKLLPNEIYAVTEGE
jgi:hypothetical protein